MKTFFTYGIFRTSLSEYLPSDSSASAIKKLNENPPKGSQAAKVRKASD